MAGTRSARGRSGEGDPAGVRAQSLRGLRSGDPHRHGPTRFTEPAGPAGAPGAPPSPQVPVRPPVVSGPADLLPLSRVLSRWPGSARRGGVVLLGGRGLPDAPSYGQHPLLDRQDAPPDLSAPHVNGAASNVVSDTAAPAARAPPAPPGAPSQLAKLLQKGIPAS